MIKISTIYNIGDMVYLETDPDQLKRQVTGIEIRPGGVMYIVACGGIESLHYEFEITPQRQVI